MEKTKVKINSIELSALGFYYDSCHKIYIVEDIKEHDKMKEYGYTDKDFYTIDRLEYIYNISCSLRFISTCRLVNIVPQFSTKPKIVIDI